jgi:1-acyl-sn-glycerol-3-phosphate acyltransferase
MKAWNYDNDQWTKLPAYLKHLPLFTRHIDITSRAFRLLWGILLKKWFFKMYIRLKVVGSFKEIYEKYPRLIIISNHASHLDATSIAAAIPFKYWTDLYITAAKDYFFSNPVFTFFSAHCLGAIPIERKDRKGEAIKLMINLLSTLDRMWMIYFPEGTRSKDGKVQDFKRGVSIVSEKTQTPVLFLFIEGNSRLWPKGAIFAKPGPLRLHVGPVVQPGPVEEIYKEYRKWAMKIDPEVFLAD